MPSDALKGAPRPSGDLFMRNQRAVKDSKLTFSATEVLSEGRLGESTKTQIHRSEYNCKSMHNKAHIDVSSPKALYP